MSLDLLFKRVFGDGQSTPLGSGWASGVVAVLAGALALRGILCFRFPEWLTTPAFRSHYPIPIFRHIVQLLLTVSFISSALSLALRRRKVLGVTGIGFCLVASVLGGSSIPLPDRVDSPMGLGLDWFLLNLLLLAVVFAPLERVWPLRSDQPAFRRGWTTDGVHFLVSHIGVQLFSIAALAPALWLGRRLSYEPWSAHVRSLPWPLQFVLTVVALVGGVSNAPDRCLNGSGLRVVFIDLGGLFRIRGSSLPGLCFLSRGLDTRQHGGNFDWLEPFLVTPRIHHFHHAVEREAFDKNFAMHLPLIDRLFGTLYLPAGRWPTGYGLGTASMPEDYWAQLIAPFRR